MSSEKFDEPKKAAEFEAPRELASGDLEHDARTADALATLRKRWLALPAPLSPPEVLALAEGAAATSAEDETFRALGQLWRELPVPSAPPERQASAPSERAFVEALRSAWATLPVPTARPTRLETERHAAAPARPWARRLRLAAAAAAALLVARVAADFPHQDFPTDVAQGPSAAADGDPERHSTSDAERPTTTQVAAVLTDTGIEMRSGPVRLVLLASSQPLDPAPTADPSPHSPETPASTPLAAH